MTIKRLSHPPKSPYYDFKVIVPNVILDLSILFIDATICGEMNNRESIVKITVPLSEIEGGYPHCIYHPMNDDEEYDLMNSLNYHGYRLDDESQDLAISLKIGELEG